MKRPRLQPLGVERHADPVMPDDLDQVAPGASENVQIAGVRIAAKRLLDLQRQAVHALAACRCGRPPARPARPRGPGSSPLQHVQHQPQRRRLDPIADPNPVPAGQLNLDQLTRRHRRGLDRLDPA